MSDPDPHVRPRDPLPYGTRDGTHSWLDRARGDVGDRVHGFVEFLGILIGIADSFARLFFAIGLSMLCFGLGQALQSGAYFVFSGPTYMAWGGFIVGLFAPLPWRRRNR